MDDRTLIEVLGGPAKVAELLGYEKEGGTQRVHNWLSRGIPPKVKLERPDLFLRPETVASASAPALDHAPTDHAAASDTDRAMHQALTQRATDRIVFGAAAAPASDKPSNPRER